MVPVSAVLLQHQQLLRLQLTATDVAVVCRLFHHCRTTLALATVALSLFRLRRLVLQDLAETDGTRKDFSRFRTAMASTGAFRTPRC